jgi:c-di-GMP-binding flagellar brake protein YcgR
MSAPSPRLTLTDADPVPARPTSAAEARHQPRLKLPAMYTLLRARLAGEKRYRWSGHLYDISLTGMRFELDLPVDPGAEVEVHLMLPGPEHTTLNVTGRVVRIHGDDEQGPARMGMTIDRFDGVRDREKLADYLSAKGLRLAA